MIFVTGGTGFVGAHVILQLLEKGYRVKAIKRNAASTGYFNQLADLYNLSAKADHQLEWIAGDILYINDLITGMAGCDKVYHCAGYVSFDGEKWDELLSSNRTGTANVVNAMLHTGIKTLCYISSVAALEMSRGIKGKKTDWKQFRKTQPYGYSKYLGELEVYRGQEEGLNVFVANPAVVIGAAPKNNPLTAMMRRLENGLNYYPPGSTGYVAAKDLARFVVELTDREYFGHAITIATEHYTFREMLEMFAIAMGIAPPQKKTGSIHFLLLKALARVNSLFNKTSQLSLPAINSLQKTTVHDTTDLEREFPQPHIPLTEAVQDAVNFYRNY